ncbi:MAG: Ycf34 family protein [Synechococcaceae cyanobacterium ELA445]|jgi:hypothetical protein
MCICVDCHWVDRCQAYHAVEGQHGVPHLQASPDFVPEAPRIHVQVMDLTGGGIGVEWDVRGCDSFRSEPGRWQRLRPGACLPS